MIENFLLKYIILFTLLIPLLSGCSVGDGRSSTSQQVQEQLPWKLTLQLVPPSERPAAGPDSAANLEAESLAKAPVVTTFKLRLQSQDPKTSMQSLFQSETERLPLNQQQNFLFYHLDEVAYLQVGDTRLHPVAAVVEMTPQRNEYLDVDFTFLLVPSQIQQASDVAFVLDNAFFLTGPVRFPLLSTQLLALSH